VKTNIILEKQLQGKDVMVQLKNKRILICGKGGCGKSSITSLLGNALQKNGYKVILLDADASNPGGLFHLLTDNKKAPKSLIEFFGGRELVTCPSDNPSPLTRINSNVPVEDAAIKLSEIPRQYSLKKENLTLFQIGKIKQACEGCDGPMSKVARDFIVKGGYVTLIDMEAGIEHFGRGVEINVDIILVIVDPVFESMIIAELVARISEMMGNKKVFAILNKIQSEHIEELMKNDLKKRNVEYIGTINHDAEIQSAGFEGTMINKSKAEKQATSIIKKLELSLKTNNKK
jgi:CO dehydrogenase maturation factor